MTLTYDCVVPTFREEGYIKGLLEALKRQTVKPHCTIVADFKTGVDRTAEIAREHGAKVIPVDHPGIGYARGLGCRFVDADCILNIDADSEPDPDLAERLLKPIEEEGCVSTFGFGGFKQEESKPWERFMMGITTMHKFIIPNGQAYAGLMVTREAYRAVGGFRDIEFWEDSDLSFRLAALFPFRVRFVPEAKTFTSIRRQRALLKHPHAHVDYEKAYREGQEFPVE